MKYNLYLCKNGDMVELVDTRDLKSLAARRNGSSPFIPTNRVEVQDP